MIRHLLTLVWHRRSVNALLALEIFASFLVVFPVAGLGLFYWRNARQPLGYDWQDVWTVRIDTGARRGGERAEEEGRTLERVVRAAAAMPAVRTASAADIVPFDFGTNDRERDGVHTLVARVTDDYLDAVDLELVAGRWFGPEDDALAFEPVVVDRDLARTLWGDENPVGRTFPVHDTDGVEERVVGVVAEFKKDGELAGPGHFTFYRAGEGSAWTAHLDRLVLEMEPGAGGDEEQRMAGELAALAPGWTFEIEPLASLRASAFRMRVLPLALGGTVALFLLVMVGLGLSGVLWQSITQRRAELGLRRALGASRSAVRRQVLLEISLLTTVAAGAGVLLVVQLPLFELAGFLDPAVFAGALAAAVGAIFGLTLLCGLYPSRLAMGVTPAAALHDE